MFTDSRRKRPRERSCLVLLFCLMTGLKHHRCSVYLSPRHFLRLSVASSFKLLLPRSFSTSTYPCNGTLSRIICPNQFPLFSIPASILSFLYLRSTSLLFILSIHLMFSVFCHIHVSEVSIFLLLKWLCYPQTLCQSFFFLLYLYLLLPRYPMMRHFVSYPQYKC